MDILYDMYTSNIEHNKIIYDLWEKNLTVNQISSTTGIPRSTVGYYVRKFNRLATKGKPVVFPGARKVPRKSSMSTWDRLNLMKLRGNVMDLVKQGEYERLYYWLANIKLMSEFGIYWKPDDFRKLSKSLG